ncbi:MAG: tetratricopeptide repeat protein [Halioglobus sp.]|nr:tetratricopeptide repeat protein [Halioglobus sp.]
MPHRTYAARLAWLLLPLVLAACATSQPPRHRPAPVEPAPQPDYSEEERVPGARTPAPAERPPPPERPVAAYGPLIDRAADARERGDYEQALALLERAQRIDPQSARVYLEIAATHHARGDYRQARTVAERGLLYCRNRTICAALKSFTR